MIFDYSRFTIFFFQRQSYPRSMLDRVLAELQRGSPDFSRLDNINKGAFLLQDCEQRCPCESNCPAGCKDCPQHALCQDDCVDAQLNNAKYLICLNQKILEMVNFYQIHSFLYL